MAETKTTAPKAEEPKTEETKTPASAVKAVKDEGIFGGVAYHNNPVKADVQVESK